MRVKFRRVQEVICDIDPSSYPEGSTKEDIIKIETDDFYSGLQDEMFWNCKDDRLELEFLED